MYDIIDNMHPIMRNYWRSFYTNRTPHNQPQPTRNKFLKNLKKGDQQFSRRIILLFNNQLTFNNTMNAIAVNTPVYMESFLSSLDSVYDHEQEECLPRRQGSISQNSSTPNQFATSIDEAETYCPPSILRRQKASCSPHSVSFCFVAVSILNDDGTIIRDVSTRLIGSPEIKIRSFAHSLDKRTSARESNSKSSKLVKSAIHKKYHLGDKPRTASDIVIGLGENKSQALASVSSLKVHDYAFVKRRNGNYSYSILADRTIAKNPKGGKEEECMIFVTSPEGHSKIIKRKYWADMIGLVKDDNCSWLRKYS